MIKVRVFFILYGMGEKIKGISNEENITL